MASQNLTGSITKPHIPELVINGIDVLLVTDAGKLRASTGAKEHKDAPLRASTPSLGGLVKRISSIGEASRVHTMKISPDGDLLTCGKVQIYIHEITDVRKGQTTTNFKKLTNHNDSSHQSRSFSVIHGLRQTLDAIALDQTSRDLFYDCLNQIREYLHSQESADPEHTRAVAEWLKHTNNGAEKQVDLSGTTKLLKSLNLNAKKAVVKELLHSVDVNGNGKLEFVEFIELMRKLRIRTCANKVFDQFSANKVYLLPDELLKFLKDYQGQSDADVDLVNTIVKQFQPQPIRTLDGKPLSSNSSKAFPIDIPVLYRAEFSRYLESPFNGIAKPKYDTVYQDMRSWSITNYFVASSHNTYLSGNQLQSRSDIEMYAMVLLRGCRCVELDVWDGANNKPVIYHGHTLTSQIPFYDTLVTIRDHAFKTSPFPVILSLEVHCSITQQNVMADMLLDVFGKAKMLPEMWTKQELATGSADSKWKQLPSPYDLKYKILLKGSTIKIKEKAAPLPSTPTAVTLSGHTAASALMKSSTPATATGSQKDKAAKPEKVSEKLSNIMYLRATHFNSLTESNNNPPYKMSSFSEAKLAKLGSNPSDASLLVDLNRSHFSRIYPSGKRLFSSNYDPFPGWRSGSQLVALNYQTRSTPLYMSLIKFQQNGNCGYLLKPFPLRSLPLSCSSENKHQIINELVSQENIDNEKGRILVLAIEVLDGRQLPLKKKKKVVDPFVKITIGGRKAVGTGGEEGTGVSWKTKSVAGNGFNPNWEGERWEVDLREGGGDEEGAVVLFEVADKEAGTLGFGGCGVEGLREGLRVVQLWHPKSFERLPMSNLLVRIEGVKRAKTTKSSK
eukprot:TRINITY_DN7674_c0_g1_i1.p1 TRINITY_DN7674_c0_g1~~TRINITY_DN7674_c0_g1_i1.p1  ORF type:complete len:843 (-),score=209.62 TRINITY_DN7674_c0_g1_i1:22-2550(-)